ncbi:hypothetical protein Sjap_016047 [Stephania japonica]|uniref:Bidirectional sugar transporter SWEET n=1 Tax=Stephania japonica TaxID=461633 RepID=A0AAP0NTE2_9MAGN
MPYLAASMNCVLWVFYGMPFVHPHSTLVWTINGTELFLELCYLTTYLRFSNNQQRLKVFKIFTVEVALFAIIAATALLAFHTYTSRSMVVGIVCVIFGVCMYASPLTIVRLVIKTRSVKYMPFFLSLASFLNGIIWVIYALLRFDPYILTGNGLGTLFGAIQLLVYAYYYFFGSNESKEGAELEMSNSQVQP